MLKCTRKVVMATALLLMAAVSAQAAAPAVLTQVPDDSSVVVVVNDLKGLSTKISNTATRMNVQIPPDLLGMISQRVGLTKGLDQNGSAALFMVLPKDADKEAEQPAEPPFVLLVPTTDSKAMLGELKLGEADKAGIAQVTLPGGGDETGYVIAMDKFVAFAQDKGALTRYLAHKGPLAKALTPELAKTFEANDVIVYANVPQFADKAIKQLDDAKQGIVMMMTMGATDEKTADTLKTVMEMYFAGIKQVLTDTNAGAITLRLNDSGATLGLAGHFKAGSTLGKLAAAQKPLAAVNLDGLPAAGSILAAGTATWDPGSATDLIGKVMDVVYNSPAVAKQANVEELKKSGELQKQMMGMLTGLKFAFYEPADTSKGWLKGVQISDIADPKKYEDLLTQVAKGNFGGANAMNPSMKIEVKATPKALTVKGVELNKYVFKMAIPEDAEKTEQLKMQQKMIDTIYGPGGIVIYSGIVGEKQVVTVVGGDEKFVQSAVEAVVGKSTALSTDPEIVTAAKDAVASPSVVAYLPVDRWITLARQQFQGGAASKPAAGLAIGPVPTPVTVSIGCTQNSVTEEIHVPMSTMISISETIKEMQNQRMEMMPPTGPVAPMQ